MGDSFHDSFESDGMVVVPDFLPAPTADALNHFLTTKMPPYWWYVTSHPGPTGERTDVEHTAANAAHVAYQFQLAHRRYVEGGFAYVFLRTHHHLAGCSCLLCQVLAELQSDATLARIHEFTGIPVRASGGLFASCYSPGCFLSPHTDRDNGRLAFVWQLTRDWQPQYGGLLHILDDDWLRVQHIVHPEFNSAVFSGCQRALAHHTSSRTSHTAYGLSASRSADGTHDSGGPP